MFGVFILFLFFFSGDGGGWVDVGVGLLFAGWFGVFSLQQQ